MGQLFYPEKALGQLVKYNEVVVGSALLSQKFENEKYFWGRPAATENNPLPSGGSNLGQASSALQKSFIERKEKMKTIHSSMPIDPPQDLLFASGSGLDPHISPEAALYQVERVARARGMDLVQLTTLVNQMTEKRDFGIFGEPRVNVLNLNLALEQEGLKK